MKRYRIDPSLCANKTCLIRLRYDKRLGGKTEFKFNLNRAKQVLFWGKFNETFRIDASLFRMKKCLIRLRYDKLFGGKTELNLN
jgi:hypothetical protein